MMSSPKLKLNRFQRELLADPNWPWANVMNLPSENVEAYGIAGAMELNRERRSEQVRREQQELAALENLLSRSEHRSSSGQTQRMSRKERQAHYKRKGELEGRKETMRRRYYKLKGLSQSEQERREAARKARRAATRKARKPNSNRA
jgi:hypothetical protein